MRRKRRQALDRIVLILLVLLFVRRIVIRRSPARMVVTLRGQVVLARKIAA
jgi:hypothetical protein